MLCLAVDATIRCSVWQYISQSKVDWIPLFVTCLASKTEISTGYKNKTKSLNHKTKQRHKLWSRYGAYIAWVCLELSSVISCTTHLLLVSWLGALNLAA